MKEEADHNPHTSNQEDLERLRAILLEQAEQRMEQLEERLEDPHIRAEEISGVLVESIHLHGANPQPLADALLPALSESIRESVARDPHTFGDALFPVMGPAIRKSILETIRNMVQSMNQVVENSFSIQGLKWRIEALRKKKTYGEIVFLHSMKYRVEQVFLIHRETGLLLNHVSSGQAAFENADAVSGMLTAIQSFVRDSFGSGDQDEFHSMQVGDLTVWSEGGPHAVLAATIRGTPPSKITDRLRETLEHIHLVHRKEFSSFNGEISPYERSRHDLEACLLQESQQTEKVEKRRMWFPLVISIILVGMLGFFGYQKVRAAHIEKRIIQILKYTPGLVYIEVENSRGVLRFRCMKDPLAEIPRSVTTLPIEKYRFDWEPYYSLEPDLVLARAGSMLKTPDSITLEFERGVLVARGSAPQSWCEQARNRAVFIPGIQSYNDKDVRPDFSYIVQKIKESWEPPDSVLISVDGGIVTLTGNAPMKWIRQAKARSLNIRGVDQVRWDSLYIEEEKQLEVLTHEIEDVTLLFNSGSSALNSGQKKLLMSLSKTIQQAAELARSLNKDLRVNVSGSADPSGSPAQNKVISLKRAEKTMSFLVESGVAEGILEIESLLETSVQADSGGKQNAKRLVKFSVQLKP